MESVKTEVIIRAAVIAIEEKFKQVWKGGIGKDAIFQNVSQGWYIGLQGSWEWLYVGESRPDIRLGQIATIRISFNE